MKKLTLVIAGLLILGSISAQDEANIKKDIETVKKADNSKSWWSDFKNEVNKYWNNLFSKTKENNAKQETDQDNSHYNCIIPLGVAGIADVEADKDFDCPGIKTKIEEDEDKSDEYLDANMAASSGSSNY